MIPRPDYIRAITPFIDVPLVKILAGVRRCGKSTILEMIKEALKKRGIPEEHIISRKYTEMDIDDGFSAKDMYLELTAATEAMARDLADRFRQDPEGVYTRLLSALYPPAEQ